MSFSDGKVNEADAKQLGEFNAHLSTCAYVNGFAPSKADATAFSGFKAAPAAKFPHVARWYKHIASFEAKERTAWAGASSSGPQKATSSSAAADDDFDLFDDESEDDEEKERITQERLKAYAEKKSKKPGPIAKSNVIYDVKPWDDEIDPLDIEKKVREIKCEGLIWGSSKIVPVAFGIKKLQICCVIEDDKVSTDWLEEQITDNEDLVQSVDVVAFNKV